MLMPANMNAVYLRRPRVGRFYQVPTVPEKIVEDHKVRLEEILINFDGNEPIELWNPNYLN